MYIRDVLPPLDLVVCGDCLPWEGEVLHCLVNLLREGGAGWAHVCTWDRDCVIRLFAWCLGRVFPNSFC